MKIKLASFVFGFLFFLLLSINSIYAKLLLDPKGYVNDYVGVLTVDQQSYLENLLVDFEQKTGNEISIVLIKTLDGQDINDFTNRVFEEWKIGKEKKDNGVLFLAAIEDKKMRIEVGYGLEPYLTDGQAGEIIRTTIAPEFKTGDYYQGLYQGILDIEAKVSGEIPDTPLQAFSKYLFKNVNFSEGVLYAFWLFGSLFVYLCSFMARSKSIWLGGVLGVIIGLVIGFVVAKLLIGIVSVVTLGLLGLLLDLILSRNYQKLKKENKDTSWLHSGGGFWAGGKSGGGFGGFGGGRSGGGGASGSW